MSKSFLNIILVFLLLGSISAKAQYYDSSYVHKKPVPENESPWKKMFYGGGVGLAFGNPTYFDISPVVGYRITPKISAGVGVTYQYYDYSYASYNFSTNVYGGSVFGRYYFRKNLFAHGEIEYLNLAAFDNLETRVGVESVLVGGGFMQHFSPNSGIVAMLLYDLTDSEYSPYYYNPIIIRLGVNIGF